MTLKTTLKSLTVASIMLGATSIASASDFGCQALMCFAGGKGVAECQSTIRQVLKDMAKGEGFPSCTFVSSNGGVAGSSDDKVSTRRYTQNVPYNQRYCQDGETRPTKSPMTRTAYCKTIEINISPDYAASPEHVKQYFNYD